MAAGTSRSRIRSGCSYLAVQANEKSGGTIIGDLIDSRDNLPPKTPALFELDSTSGGGNVWRLPGINRREP